MSLELQLTRLNEILTAVIEGKSSEVIKHSTAALNDEFLTKPTTILLLTKLYTQSQNPGVRQLAAIELNKLTKKFWIDLEENIRVEVKKALLEIVVNEEKQLLRTALTESIASIAENDLVLKQWPELFPFVMQCCQSPTVLHREVGVMLLAELFDIINDNFNEELSHLFEVAKKAIVDQESEFVRRSGFKILIKFIDIIPSENKAQINSFQEVIPSIVSVLEDAIKNDRENEVQSILDVFEVSLLSEAPLLNKHFKDLYTFIVNVSLQTSVSDSIRCGTINQLMWSIMYKKTRVGKNGLIEPYIKLCLQVMSEETSEDDLDENCPANSGANLLASMAEQLSPQQVYPFLAPLIYNYVHTAVPNNVKAALNAVGVTAYGCSNYLSSQVSDLLPMVAQYLRHENAQVRIAACYALSQLTEYLSDEVVSYHDRIMPELFPLLNDNNNLVCIYAWESVEALMASVDDKAINYLPQLMEKCGESLDRLSVDQRMCIINAVTAAANSAGPLFAPYFQNFMARLSPYLQSKDIDQDSLKLKSTALDAAGVIVSSVGNEVALPYIQDIMTIAFEAMSIKGSFMRESAFDFFGSASNVLGPQFNYYLHQVIKEASITLNQSEMDDEDDNSEDLENPQDEQINYRSDLMTEKEFALRALGTIATNTKKEFLPYLEELTTIAIKKLDHYCDEIRKASYETLLKFIITATGAHREVEHESGVLPYPQLHPNVVTYIHRVMPEIMDKWKNEYDIETCITLFCELDTAICFVGPELIGNYINDLSSLLMQTFNKESSCQIFEEDDEVDTENTSELESVLIGSAADVVGALAKVVGPDFLEIFRTFYPSIKKYFKPNVTESERNLVVAVLGDIISGLKHNTSEFTLEFLEILLVGLQDKNAGVRSNSAYSVGKLCELTTVDITNHYGTILSLLSPLFAIEGKNNARDNACGAVCRLILKNPQSCPIDEAIPAIISMLPLEIDYQENNPVYQCLAFLIKAKHPVVNQYMGQLAALFKQMLTTPDRVHRDTLEIIDDVLKNHM
ncbi:ARM repeat-containing protein [Neoconidiobolus thromboides FSU 785]|nr:ARM repeat-containing protein [Neoconidiobolus thromboides FSU 785]